ncbi:TetR/AcrR family transcriptional regulator [Tamlana fucoidanivorans]|uniref:TetR/AcrR family transcriptional regulator n=1 Tax=Allotamlana fucoidanivorans TaxID=2583814 RepID=A0A5C4SRT9_9FLAO|nr:TetR/AcrR family transcriptional regulator [Tamlana fucoidanivorans]TNJ47140.1 TetR/AcrR family transcriptional regulator [Tamlana fucoidanivorans]
MNKKQRILSSALKILAEQGLHNTPMSAIGKAATTGMGTIYNYFPNKEALINEIYTDIKKQESLLFENFDSNKPIKTQFENYFTIAVTFFIDNSYYFAFMEQMQASPIITENSKEEGRKAITPIFELLMLGKQQRIIKNIDIEEILMFIGGAILSYLRWYYNQTEKNQTSLENQVIMVWDAIKE